MTFGMEEIGMVWLRIDEKNEDIFIYFDRIHERDRQKDGRTDTTRRHRPRLGIASRGKNNTHAVAS